MGFGQAGQHRHQVVQVHGERNVGKCHNRGVGPRNQPPETGCSSKAGDVTFTIKYKQEKTEILPINTVFRLRQIDDAVMVSRYSWKFVQCDVDRIPLFLSEKLVEYGKHKVQERQAHDTKGHHEVPA